MLIAHWLASLLPLSAVQNLSQIILHILLLSSSSGAGLSSPVLYHLGTLPSSGGILRTGTDPLGQLTWIIKIKKHLCTTSSLVIMIPQEQYDIGVCVNASVCVASRAAVCPGDWAGIHYCRNQRSGNGIRSNCLRPSFLLDCGCYPASLCGLRGTFSHRLY